MTLTIHIPAPDLALVQTLVRYAIGYGGVMWLMFQIWMENK